MGWVEIIGHDSLPVCICLLFCGLEWVGDLAQSDQEISDLRWFKYVKWLSNVEFNMFDMTIAQFAFPFLAVICFPETWHP